MTHINAVAFTIVFVCFLIVTIVGFAAARWRPAEDLLNLHQWGLGGRGFGAFISWFLLGGDIYTAYTFIAVPALVYATGAARVLRAVLLGHDVPDRVHLRPAALVGRPQAQLRHPGRLHPGPVRLAGPGPRGGVHRDPGHHALHRAAARRHRVRADRARRRHQLEQRVPQGPALDHRVHHPRRLHLPGRAARPGHDRVHQGHAGLRDRHRRDPVHTDEARRLGTHLRRLGGAPEGDQPGDRKAERRPRRDARPASGPSPPSRSARRWRCSCTRTSSPGCSPPSGATWSGATWPRCPPTR